ncbi:hypothetical protein CGZ75_21880 [Paenibacillus herberti]|uniref:Uncharacterized protein n=1 Tax=Paenibacillus herberti TaxID=1619309 RepID=A0A229NUW1_9BACL|nr:hypothetical protein CGZ75_21880 [Paenibacillus herberti]
MRQPPRSASRAKLSASALEDRENQQSIERRMEARHVGSPAECGLPFLRRSLLVGSTVQVSRYVGMSAYMESLEFKVLTS